MKTPLLCLLLCVATSFAHAQILLQTGFEDWTQGAPSSLFGPNTDFPLDSISVEEAMPYAGEQAVRLRLGVLAEKRLTTAPLPVIAGELYDIRYWVRGSARLRTSVNDGRPEANGFAPYTLPSIVDDTTTWRIEIQTVYVTNTSNAAEFVIAIEGTADTCFLVIDNLVVVASSLPDVTLATIAQIQTTSSPFGSSPLNFQFVRTNGIVTGMAPNSFFFQDGAGPWSGIHVYSRPPEQMAIGDSITIMAEVTEFQGLDVPWPETLTELIVVRQILIHSTGHPPPAPSVISANEANSEPWENVLVKIPDLECLTLPQLPDHEWMAAGWQGTALVDDLMYLHSPTVGDFYTITGIMYYDGAWKLEPRSAADFEVGVGMDEVSLGAISIYPNPANDQFTIALGEQHGRTEISLFDATGRCVLTDVVLADRHSVDVSGLSNGVYTLVLGTFSGANAQILVVRH